MAVDSDMHDEPSRILAVAGEAVVCVQASGRITYANAAVDSLLGWSPDALVGRGHEVLEAQVAATGNDAEVADSLSFSEAVAAALSGRSVHCDDQRLRCRDGRLLAVESCATPLCVDDRVTSAVVTFHDITALRRREQELAESENVFRALMASLEQTPVILLDRNTTILSTFVAPTGAERYGLYRESVDGTRLTDMLPEDQAQNARDIVELVFDTGESQRAEQTVSLPTGEYVYDVHYSPVCGPNGRVRSVLSLSLDITDRVRAEEQIRSLAFYDSLTGLPNRRFFLERLEAALDSARRHGRLMALLFLDLDHFKRVNDTLGHSAGDRLLAQVAERLQSCVRTSDAVARTSASEGDTSVSRLGGDEFTLLLSEISTANDAAAVADRVVDALSTPFNLDRHEVFANPSIGIAVFPHDAGDAESLLRNADVAMYSAKSLGRNCYRFYADSMNETALRNLYLDGRLRGALDRDEFRLVYQPVRDARTGDLIGAEALLRWEDGESGLVSPAEFIPIAEDTGTILQIGEWVLQTACGQWSEWQRQGYVVPRLAVNLSGVQLRQDDLVDRIVEILEAAQLSPGKFELEITESTIMQEDASTISALSRLAEMGIGIALDDFGTGYSSLSYLRRFPIHRVKIDRSFVGGIATHPDEAALTSAIIAMAHSLRLSVVAEGVETQEQAIFLCDHGCDELQGYLFSPPIPAAKFRGYLDREKPDEEAADEPA
ncbi:MAG: EAL domain-containing protein [Myxococcales bacterium]|nr:EAL domain-containing protein [Myxococcales bacterium]